MSVAVFDVTRVAAEVVAVGAACVVKFNSEPNEVPSALDAIAQKKYIVPGDKPVIACEYACVEVPDPSADPPLDGARIPNVSLHVPGLVALYRNHPVVVAPFGLPEPFSVAVVSVIGVAAEVVAVGGSGVVNVLIAPRAVPTEF